MENIQLAIVGSRDMTSYKDMETHIDLALKEWSSEVKDITLIVSGGCKGADQLGEQFAKKHKIKTMILKPDWKTYGKRAGILRNHDIIGNATHVIAFPSKKGSGTQHSIEIAKKQNKPTYVHFI